MFLHVQGGRSYDKYQGQHVVVIIHIMNFPLKTVLKKSKYNISTVSFEKGSLAPKGIQKRATPSLIIYIDGIKQKKLPKFSVVLFRPWRFLPFQFLSGHWPLYNHVRDQARILKKCQENRCLGHQHQFVEPARKFRICNIGNHGSHLLRAYSSKKRWS